jgi:hypothetical protein
MILYIQAERRKNKNKREVLKMTNLEKVVQVLTELNFTIAEGTTADMVYTAIQEQGMTIEEFKADLQEAKEWGDLSRIDVTNYCENYILD